MAKITALTAEATLADGDLFAVVDVSDTAQSANGSTNKMTAANVATGAPFTSRYLALAAGGSSVENIGAVESNVNTVGTSGSTETLDTSVYGVHDVTMDQACTFTFSNPAPSGKCTVFILILRGSFTPTFPGSVDWGDGTPPSYTTPAIYVFTTVDAGSIWLGKQVGKAFA
jgi:hypothetical protein